MNEIHSQALIELGTRAGNDAIQIAMLAAQVKALTDELNELKQRQEETDGINESE